MKVTLVFLGLLGVALGLTDFERATQPKPAPELPRTDEWVTWVNGKPVDASRAGELIFEDNFDDLDLNIWSHEKTMSGGGNFEFQVYDNNRTSSYVQNGFLFIKPGLTDERYGVEGFTNNGAINLHGGSPADECTNPAWVGCERFGDGSSSTLNPTVSARVRTINSFSFKYGVVEARAKMPRGDWIWPAIWMLPKNNHYGGWPASGEIDLVESRGNLDMTINGKQIGHRMAGSTLHYGPFYPFNGYERATFDRESEPGYGAEFHDYRVEWTPEYIRFFYDNVELGTIDPGAGGFWTYYPFEEVAPGAHNPWEGGTKMTPFDQEFYLILNVAVGGTNGFFPDGVVNAGYPKPWANDASNAFNDFYQTMDYWLPTWDGEDSAMIVDYVRVYAL